MSKKMKDPRDKYEAELSSGEEAPEEVLEDASEPVEGEVISEVEETSEVGEESELEKAKREVRENYDKFLRVFAEFENYKKRMERERAEFIKYANEGLIKDHLSVVDNFERAVEQAGENTHAEGLVQGMEMVLKQFKEIHEKYGVREIQALGEPFDPNLHEAMMHEVSNDHDENTVIGELQKGYILKDRLLRPTLVKVSKKAEKNADVSLEDPE
jgi:molecular chaperone GrpE